ncbi:MULTISPECIES: cytochrome P450 [unclassified Rhizobium]|uniref:cytochrome P450 n=1 Tax=unclassified Rhizobium TaxID=2613769 RepID=UPI001ADC8475|nr:MULTISPECIES: cytochrome P450 [unclassified Rhizobium]MBO9097797.1 cytochrome P450 [Rhizobium sp. L58/93]MBO9167948.1 cytochrome P450 [Rhizobium sp. L245/93]MBO9183992.1 cytochrome P450 [Rhizobium sp. E27B/91]QXZ84218.1 cytochrome P450 [Rhizobium sp. K1/93]QXZ91643.1 cytochrome P450 [Rhizobium sp. K15/93]
MASFKSSSGSDASDVPTLSMETLASNPHEVYRHFRGELPFIRSEAGVYLVLRADDVLNLYSDAKTRQVETELINLRGVKDGPIWDFMTNGMLTSNGDAHTRRRSPMAKTFAFRMIAALRPHIRQTISEIADAVTPDGCMDMLDDFATVIPARVIASILGLPRDDVSKFSEIVYRFSPLLGGSWLAQDVPELQQAAGDLRRYVGEIVTRRSRDKADDFVSEFMSNVEEEGSLTAEEAITQIMTLIVGGSDTTRSAMVIQLSLLLQHPDQWNAVVENRDLVPNAVLECLRYEPAIGSVPRVTTMDIQLDGYVLPAHKACSLVTMSALRDEKLYPEPERFDISREQLKWHPVFGGGAHRCLGEALARAELEEALTVLAERFPGVKAAGEFPKVRGFSGIRQVQNFAVTLNA